MSDLTQALAPGNSEHETENTLKSCNRLCGNDCDTCTKKEDSI